MMMSEDEMIAVEADLNIHDSPQPMRPTPTLNNGGDGNHDHGGAVVSALRSTIWKKMRAGRRKRSHQFLLEGVKDVEQDSIKDDVEEACRSKNVLGFKNQSDLIDSNITTFSVMSSSIQHQVVKNNNQKKEKKKKKMMMMMKKAVKNIQMGGPQQPTYTVTKVAPMRLVFTRVHPSSEDHSLQNNDGKGKKRKMNDAGLEDLENKITKLRLTMSDSKRATCIACQRAPFNPNFDLNLPCFA